jgi:hypothetical protein
MWDRDLGSAFSMFVMSPSARIMCCVLSRRVICYRLGLDYPQLFSLNFSSYITFWVTSSIFHPLFFLSPAAVSLNTLPISHYNYKISFLYILFIYYKFFIY